VVEVGGIHEFPKRPRRFGGERNGLGLDDGHLAGDPPEALYRPKRFLEVVNHAEKQHHVEGAQWRQIHREKVAHDSFRGAVQHTMREVESTLARKPDRIPEVGHVMECQNRLARCMPSRKVVRRSWKIDGPRIMVQRDNAAGARAFGHERVITIPGADVEHRLVREIGQVQPRQVIMMMPGCFPTRGHHPIA
jgi:hypothetical protein